MKFEFAKYTEITTFAFKTDPEYKKEGYVRLFICPDTNNYWLVRILKGYNEDYDKEEGSFILERTMIDKDRGEKLQLQKLRKIIQEDDRSNWDIKVSYDVEELIDMLDDGFGVNFEPDKTK